MFPSLAFFSKFENLFTNTSHNSLNLAIKHVCVHLNEHFVYGISLTEKRVPGDYSNRAILRRVNMVAEPYR
jgi:hypothetical protein